LLPHGFDNVTFSHTALSRQNEIVPPADELAGGQFFDAGAVDGFGVELPIECGQRLRFAEVGLADAMGDAPFAALGRLFGNDEV
jgi:hypothetical protein